MQNIAPNYGQSVLLVSATVYGILVHELLESLNRAYLNCHNSTSLRGKLHKKAAKRSSFCFRSSDW